MEKKGNLLHFLFFNQKDQLLHTHNHLVFFSYFSPMLSVKCLNTVKRLQCTGHRDHHPKGLTVPEGRSTDIWDYVGTSTRGISRKLSQTLPPAAEVTEPWVYWAKKVGGGHPGRGSMSKGMEPWMHTLYSGRWDRITEGGGGLRGGWDKVMKGIQISSYGQEGNSRYLGSENSTLIL